MARYRSTGGLDDPRLDDGDVGFRGVNLRLPAWQLEPGILSLSENGRIDGEWVPRKGMDVVAATTLENGSPLRLPFFITDTDSGLAISAASRVDELVTLTVTGHGYDTVTGGAVSATLDPTGANNGIYLEAAEGIESGEVSCEILSAITPLDLGVTQFDVIVADVSLVGNKITVQPGTKFILSSSGVPGLEPILTAHDIYNGKPFYQADIGDTLYYDGTEWQYTATGYAAASGPTSADYPIGLTFTPFVGSGSPTIASVEATGQDVVDAINGTGVSNVLVTASNAPGSDGTGEVAAVSETFLFGSPLGEAAYITVEGLGFVTTDPNGVYLLTPTDENTLTYSIPGATGSETYTIGGSDDIIVARLDDTLAGEILGSCVFSDPNSDNAESVFLAFETMCKVVDLADGSVSEVGYPGSELLTGEVSLIQAFDKVLLFRAGEVAMEWSPGDTDFALVANGTYTQPQVLTSSGASISIADGLVTFTVAGNTTIAARDTITIYSATDTRFSEVVGNRYQIVSANSTTVTCYIALPDSASGSNNVQIGKQVSIGGGFIHQPGFPWAIHFQRRLWGPYLYDWDVSLTPDAFSSRDITDELIVSDILDADTYDVVYNQFRITGGTADHIVGMHPFYDDTLLVFNRNSIHAVSGVVGSLSDASVRELTREVGCLARRSIVTQGNSIFFLSDNGVYGLSFVDQYNLRGMERPISEAIQPYIDRISWSLADKAVGVYFENRYYLAVPLDSSPRAGDAAGNNAILVYNMLYGQWESVDTFGDPGFLILDLLIATGDKRNDIYAVASNGGLHVLNRLESDYDTIAVDPGSSGDQFEIAATMRTRGYICGTTERKRFGEFYANVRGGASQSDASFTFSTDDPDNTGATIKASDTLDDNISAQDTADIRGRVGGVRGFNGMVQITRVLGRPEVRSVRVSATMTNRQTISHS